MTAKKSLLNKQTDSFKNPAAKDFLKNGMIFVMQTIGNDAL